MLPEGRSCKAKQLNDELCFPLPGKLTFNRLHTMQLKDAGQMDSVQSGTLACFFMSFLVTHQSSLLVLQGNEACPSAGLACGALVWLGGLTSSYRVGVEGGWGYSYVIMFMHVDRCAEKYFAATDCCRLSFPLFAPGLFNCISAKYIYKKC